MKIKENIDNKENLISHLKKIKKGNSTSRVILMLGAGFSKHVYGIPLWREIAKKYLGPNNDIDVLSDFTIQLIIDKMKYDGAYQSYLKPENNNTSYKGIKIFYDEIRKNSKIITTILTTNHCESIKNYFDINENFILDIENMKDNNFANFYNKNEVILNIHGSFKNNNEVISIEDYQQFFLENYKKFFKKLKDINDQSNGKIIQNTILIYGSSLQEKHLIALSTSLYKNDVTIFYVNHEKITSEIHDIFKFKSFQYISTCFRDDDDDEKCKDTDKCNDLFFRETTKEIEVFYSMSPEDLNWSYVKYNKEIIIAITKLSKYRYDHTSKEIVNIISSYVEDENILFNIRENYNFIGFFLRSSDMNEIIGANVENLYLYYFEKYNNLKDILNLADIYRNKEEYLNKFLKYIICNNKIEIDSILDEYFSLSNNNEYFHIIFNKFFKWAKKLSQKTYSIMIFNFFNVILKIDIIKIKKIFIFLSKLDNFNFKVNDNYLNKYLKSYKDKNKGTQFEIKKVIIIFLDKFFELKYLKSSIINLFPSLEEIKEINFQDENNQFSIDVRKYMSDFEFINFIFPKYFEINKIKLSNYQEFDKNFLSNISTNFILNYFLATTKKDETKTEIDDIFNNVEFRGKLQKIRMSGIAYTYSYGTDESILKHYNEKWVNKSLSQVIKIISTNHNNDFIEYSHEMRLIIDEKLKQELETYDWKNRLEEITKLLFEFESEFERNQNNFDWYEDKKSFEIIIKKYISEKSQKISIKEIDCFLTSKIYKKYLDNLKVYKNSYSILIETIARGEFRKIEELETLFLFKYIIIQLNLNDGNIFNILSDRFYFSKNQEKENIFYFKIWEKIFKNSAIKSELIDKIIKNITIKDAEYIDNVKNIFQNIFINNEMNTFKKAAYFLFDSNSGNYSRFIDDEKWMFSDRESIKLETFFVILSYIANININFKDNLQLVQFLYIKYQFKRLFCSNYYKNTNLCHYIIFHDKKTLLNSDRSDYLFYEFKQIYSKFYNNELLKFNDKIQDDEKEYIFKLFINLTEYGLKKDDFEMIENIHISLKKQKNNCLFPDEADSIIERFVSYEISRIEERNLMKEILFKYKFCLLLIKRNHLIKKIKQIIGAKTYYFKQEERDVVIENIEKVIENYLCNCTNL